MNKSFGQFLWDSWCILSVVGIWPRFIEPNLISTKKLTVPIEGLPRSWEGARIIQFSDLHLNAAVTDSFLRRLSQKIMGYKPDIILFTGDFVCYGSVQEGARLKKFLQSLSAPLGCFSIYGNHDYSQFVSVNAEGFYDIQSGSDLPVLKGFQRLFKPIKVKGATTKKAFRIPLNDELNLLLSSTPFQTLHNRCVTIAKDGAPLNLAGVGEHMIGYCEPDKAFEGWNGEAPGIVLAHNPDCVPLLSNYPGDLILCGHTHGGQINLPVLGNKFILMENRELKSGLKKYRNKTVYVNRGVGGIMRFRWFAPPEVTLITLEAT